VTEHDHLVNVSDFERLAAEKLDAGVAGYFFGGAGDELTLRENVAAWGRWRLRPRMLAGLSEWGTGAEVLGGEVSMPVLVAPVAYQGLVDPGGETAMARAAAAVGTVMCLSTLATQRPGQVAEAVPGGRRWFQLYCFEEEAVTRALIEEAVGCGYEAIVVTVDAPRGGNRERDLRSGFEIDLGVHLPAEQPVDPETGIVVLPTFDWDELAWLRSVCPIPLVVKGVLRADDAGRAVDAGCDGVWVSNHGGRQLDTAVAGADALPEIAAAVGGRTLLVIDGGVRRGVDVLKGLALGADLVAIGRPALWGLAVDGADGVQRVIELLRDELSLAMALSGCRSIAEVTPDLLAAPHTDRVMP